MASERNNMCGIMRVEKRKIWDVTGIEMEADKTNKDQSQKVWDLETDLKIKIADLSNKDQNIKDLRESIADLKAQNKQLMQNIADKDNYIKSLNNALIQANIKAKTQKNSNPNNNKQN